MKFRHPAQSDIQARGDIDDEERRRFERQFERKGRAGIAVSVELIDENGTVTMTGTYEWFVQRIEVSQPGESS